MIWNDIQSEAIVESFKDFKNSKLVHAGMKKYFDSIRDKKSKSEKFVNYALLPITAGVVYPFGMLLDLVCVDMNKHLKKAEIPAPTSNQKKYWLEDDCETWEKTFNEPLMDVEMFWTLDYSVSDVLKLAKNNQTDAYERWTKWLIEACETEYNDIVKKYGDTNDANVKSSLANLTKMIKYCKAAEFGCIYEDGCGDGFLMNIKDKNIFTFFHEDIIAGITSAGPYSALLKQSEKAAREGISPEKLKEKFGK